MAATERNTKGKATDFVAHLSMTVPGEGPVLCGNKKFGYATTDKSEVTCLKCLAKMKETK
jgi:hypothetical protein